MERIVQPWHSSPGQWLSPHGPGGIEKLVGVGLGDMVRGGLGSAGLKVGLDELRGFFQPEQLHETSSHSNSSDKEELNLVLNMQLSIKMGKKSALFL